MDWSASAKVQAWRAFQDIGEGSDLGYRTGFVTM